MAWRCSDCSLNWPIGHTKCKVCGAKLDNMPALKPDPPDELFNAFYLHAWPHLQASKGDPPLDLSRYDEIKALNSIPTAEKHPLDG